MGTEYNNENESLIHKVPVPQSNILAEARHTLTPIRDLLIEDEDPFREYRGQTALTKVKLFFFGLFPILRWGGNYKLSDLPGDIIGGLTIASLAVPQDLGYAKLANLPPVNGLYSSFVPPLVYAVFGSSMHIAIGPVAVVSLVLGDLLSTYYKPTISKTSSTGVVTSSTNPVYYDLAITATFFAGVIQMAMGIFRLGFIIDFLSHAVVIGFMAGAAVTIGLAQLKSLLGYKDFTGKSDIISVFTAVSDYSSQFSPPSFAIGISFLVFLAVLKILNYYFKKNKIIFFAAALGPLISVIVATGAVYGAHADQHGVKVVGDIKKGVNPSSLSNIHFHGEIATNGIKVGVVAGLVALTEAVAIGRTFAALKGYHIDGNKEMLAIGTANVCGSMSSSYIATGSFSRSAVNFASGGNTPLVNIIMAIVVLITLVAITPLFKYLPNAVLASIIMTAVAPLINIPGAYQVWKTDKLDFIALLGAFFGVVFVSVEIGLLIAVILSGLKVLIHVARPHTAVLGRIDNTTVYRSISQYPEAQTAPGILVIRIDAAIYFANANFIREKVERLSERYVSADNTPLQFVILELTPVADIDTTGVHALEELHRALAARGIRLGLSNPSKPVLWKLEASDVVTLIGQENLFVAVHEGVKVCSMLVGQEKA